MSDPAQRALLLQTLRRRADDFRSLARGPGTIRAVLAMESLDTAFSPVFLGQPGLDHALRGCSGETLPVVRQSTLESGWRVAHRHAGSPVLRGPPPQSFVENEAVDCPTSTFPKPWGFFWPDCPDIEVATLYFAGDSHALRQYRQMARMTLRAFVEGGLPDAFHKFVAGASRLLRTNEDPDFWTVLLFASCWNGLAPGSISAERHTWWGPLLLPFDAAHRDAALEQFTAPRHPIAQVLANTPRPAAWRHFYAELDPDLNTASAELIDEVVRQLEHPARVVSASLASSAEARSGAPGSTRPNKVFVSYASEDKARFVESFANALIAKGVDVFFGGWDVPLGESVSERVSEGLRIYDTFVLVASDTSLVKRWVTLEVSSAIDAWVREGRPLVPVTLDGCESRLPQLLRPFRRIEVADTSDVQGAVNALLAAIHGHHGKPALGLPGLSDATVEQRAQRSLSSNDWKVLAALASATVEEIDGFVPDEQAEKVFESAAMPREEFVEALEALQEDGLVRLTEASGPAHYGPGIVHVRVTTDGFEEFLNRSRPEYREEKTRVLRVIGKDDMSTSEELGEVTGMPPRVLSHIAEWVNDEGLAKTTMFSGPERRFRVGSPSVKLRRMLSAPPSAVVGASAPQTN